MAALSTHLISCSSPSSTLLSIPSTQQQQHLFFRPRHSKTTTTTLRVEAQGSDLLNGIGERDPFPAEIASNFGENVVGNMDTEHKILIPNASFLSLAQLDCSPVSPSLPPISLPQAHSLLLKVVGWRLLDEKDGLRLQCSWKVKDFESGVELINRISKVAEAAGHFPTLLHQDHPNEVTAELWTPLIGGLSMNDFILAAKLDDIETSDLVPRKRVWA